MSSEESEAVFPEAAPGNILYARRSVRGRFLVVGAARGATAHPRILDGADGSPIEMLGFDGVDWDVVDISADERLMTYTRRDGAARNLYLYEFETGEHRALRP